jgi:CMP-N,N'-diacetyllegionaminic acid synthase
MYDNLIVVVLARGNSKRLKKKNLKKIGGKTLVELAIEIPVSLGLTTIVSSENPKILNLAKKNGAIQHIRPKELSSDETTSEEVIIQILKDIDLSNKSEILLLQPTSPLRQKKQFIGFLKTWDTLKAKDKINQAISVTRETGDFWVYRKNRPERVRELISDTSEKIQRNSQLRETFYRENGLYYISEIAILDKYRSLINGKLGLIETDKITAIDIDDQCDLEIAQLIHKKYE